MYRYDQRDYQPPPRDDTHMRRQDHSSGYSREYPSPVHQMDQAPAFSMDHLATFTVSAGQGKMSPDDAMKRLREMEKKSGIWAMKCVLVIESRDIVILEPRPRSRDLQDGDEMERFPLESITDPSPITSAYRGSVYDNVLTFSVMEDPRDMSSALEIHLFQVHSTAAREVVDEIKKAKAREGGDKPRYRRPSPGVKEIDPDYDQQSATREFQPTSRPDSMLRQSYNDDRASTTSEQTDRNVQLLNRCFDDIEKFVNRLQMAADAYREADRRQGLRDGRVNTQARPPPVDEYISIFQKFKLAFNLLAKLESHIHDPNAPELVHFLFKPLSLIVDTSKDPRNNAPDLPSRVISPLLTRKAKELLQHCLTSTESKLWESLGDAWTIPREEWKGHVPPYLPRFSDDWEPPASWMEDDSRTVQAQSRSEQLNRQQDGPRIEDRVTPYSHPDDRPYRDRYSQDQQRQTDYGRDPYSRNPPVTRDEPVQMRREDRAYRYRDSDPDYPPQRGYPPHRDEYRRQQDPYRRSGDGVGTQGTSAARTWDEQQNSFLSDLRAKGVRYVEATHDRQGRNARELTVRKGEILEVIEDSKNWWQLRNSAGEVAHAPYTILIEASRYRK